MVEDRQDRRRHAPGAVPAAELIETTAALRHHCRRWREAPALGIDTEFVRTRTFFPQLGLVQVADGEHSALVDVVAVRDLEPLAALLAQSSVVKVMHSAGEDLEVCSHVFGVLPQPLFDTQLAATIAGYGYSVGYQRLVKLLFGIDLPKGETRSNWLRRPLSRSQIEYATLDVAHLLPIHQQLTAELRAKCRLAWLAEEIDRLAAGTRARLDPEYSFGRLRAAGSFAPRELALLRELCGWREQEARRRDLPRGFVLSDEALLQLVRRKPTRVARLADIKGLKGLKGRSPAKDGDELVARIRAVLELDPAELPRDGSRARAIVGRAKGRVEALRNVVHKVAGELDLPPELLARRRLLEELVSNVRTAAADPLPEGLRGWRREVIGERLLRAARQLESSG